MSEAQAILRNGGAQPGAFTIWVQAVRAPSLSAAAVPVLLGTAIAARDGFFAGWRLIFALLGAVQPLYRCLIGCSSDNTVNSISRNNSDGTRTLKTLQGLIEHILIILWFDKNLN